MFTDLTEFLTTSQHWTNVNQHVSTKTHASLLTGSQATSGKPVGFLDQPTLEKQNTLELLLIMSYIVLARVSLINTTNDLIENCLRLNQGGSLLEMLCSLFCATNMSNYFLLFLVSVNGFTDSHESESLKTA